MSWAKGKSSGWAAFDLKERRKQGLLPEPDADPFPALSTSIASLHSSQNNGRNSHPSERSFSSVVLPSTKFSTSYNPSVQAGNCSQNHKNKNSNKCNLGSAFKELKELNSWADDSLIDDIMAAVEYDVGKASSLLQSMISTPSDGLKEEKKAVKAEFNMTSKAYDNEYDSMVVDMNAPLDRFAELADLQLSLKDNLKDKEKLEGGFDSGGKQLTENDAHLNLILKNLRSVPVEPEWEVDDVYLSHRKDAMKMMRAASQHSRAATNAFLRGDHISAKQLSLMAQEEWAAADKLNAKAAEEILMIRNSKNDMWKLDLHGLHAAEAIQALQKHLSKIEIQLPLNHSVSPNRGKGNTRLQRSSSLESLSCMSMVDKQQVLSCKRPTSLEVITGRGNHSRGQAALPTAVRNFLIEKWLFSFLHTTLQLFFTDYAFRSRFLVSS
ncbi:protein of unknown function DUF1771 [Dillenia turbinata]|uniref:Smr domain-containing protein n=1 Tax=Dillenia turbinata TaxID=194707 RepID=A0AAN8V6H7_9MAGN